MKSAAKRPGKRKAAAAPAEDVGFEELTSWPAATVELRPVREIVPYSWNPRTHSPEQVAQVAASIREWGWTVPVLVDERGEAIAGHGRILAAQQLGLDRVPVVVARGWTDEQRRAYRIADNKLTENSEWNNELLKVELGDLAEAGFDLDLTGFSLAERNDLLGTEDLSGQDEPAPPLPEEPVSREGDVWILGRHRLACGDSTMRGVVAGVLRGARPLLMVTDPPYGVAYDPSWRNDAGVSSTARTGKVLNDDRADWTEAWKLFPGDVAYCWHAPTFGPISSRSLEGCGFILRSQIVWAKPRFALSRGHYHWQHEGCVYATRPDDSPVADKDAEIARLRAVLAEIDYAGEHESAWYAVRRESKARWIGNRKQSTVWEIPVTDDGDSTHHGTQKPLECMARAIRNHDAPEVYEPFAGTGTTIIACELLDRSCYAVELDPGYVDVAVKRWQDRTGEVAVLESSGESFPMVAEARS